MNKPWPTTCPICGSPLSIGPLDLPGTTACQKCQHVLWFSARTEAGVAIVDVISGKIATNQDIVRVAEAFLKLGTPPRIVMNLGGVQLISSSFIAGLIALNKRMRDAHGEMILCELTPVVRETLIGAKLDKIFHMADTQSEAKAAFASDRSSSTPAPSDAPASED